MKGVSNVIFPTRAPMWKSLSLSYTDNVELISARIMRHSITLMWSSLYGCTVHRIPRQNRMRMMMISCSKIEMMEPKYVILKQLERLRIHSNSE